jgi:Flp pilus assembly protein TadB
VSKERARRRAERLAVMEKEKAVRARRSTRRQRRRALVRSLKLKRRPSSGTLYRRSRAQRTGIAIIPLIAALAVWFLVPELALRLVLIAMIVLVLPALVVVVLGRRF